MSISVTNIFENVRNVPNWILFIAFSSQTELDKIPDLSWLILYFLKVAASQ